MNTRINHIKVGIFIVAAVIIAVGGYLSLAQFNKGAFTRVRNFLPFKQTRFFPAGCPQNSVVITQADIDAARAQFSPYRITASGNYCLGENIRVSISNTPFLVSGTRFSGSEKPIILIEASDVNFDLNSYTISNDLGSTWFNNPSLRASGMSADYLVAFRINRPSSSNPPWHTNVKIFNGGITGFDVGIRADRVKGMTLDKIILRDLYSSSDFYQMKDLNFTNNSIENSLQGIGVSQVEKMNIDNNDIGLKAIPNIAGNYDAMYIKITSDFFIQNNRIRGNNYSAQIQTEGIVIAGDTKNGKIKGNTLKNIRYGIIVHRSSEMVIDQNTIHDTSGTVFPSIPHGIFANTGNENGITLDSLSGATVTANLVSGYTTGIQYSSSVTGIYDKNKLCDTVDPFYLHGGGVASPSWIQGANNTIQSNPC